MDQAELDSFRRKLLALGNRIQGDVSGLTDEALRETGGGASGNLSNVPVHLADLAMDAYSQEVAMEMLENETQTQAEIAAALERIEQGSFGRCEECRQEIPQTRLQVLPYTRHCVSCAEKIQGQTPQG